MHCYPYDDGFAVVSDGGPGNWNPTGNVYKVPIVPQSDDGEPLTADDAGAYSFCPDHNG